MKTAALLLGLLTIPAHADATCRSAERCEVRVTGPACTVQRLAMVGGRSSSIPGECRDIPADRPIAGTTVSCIGRVATVKVGDKVWYARAENVTWVKCEGE